MKNLNFSAGPALKEFELKKINYFLKQKTFKALSYNGRPAWMFPNGSCYFLNEKSKIKPITIRELTERGYCFKSERGYCRFTRWTVTKDDMISRADRENEEAVELEEEMALFWSDKMSIKIGPPSSYKLMNSIK